MQGANVEVNKEIIKAKTLSRQYNYRSRQGSLDKTTRRYQPHFIPVQTQTGEAEGLGVLMVLISQS